MKRFVPVVALAALAACSGADAPTAPGTAVNLQANEQSGTAPYIIVLNEDADARSVMAIARVVPTHIYATALNGFSADLNQGQLTALQHNPNVAWVEPDQVVTLAPTCGTVKNPCTPDGNGSPEVVPWGVARVGGGLSGVGKVAWIIDTGIDLTNSDLTVDVARSRNFTNRSSAADENGHGTHVAGTVAAIDNDIGVIGVAAGATVVSVRVLDARGSGQYSWIIAGVDYVAATAKPGDVANMSLGGSPSNALDTSVKNAAAKGIRFTLSAGNDGAFAGNQSPARAEGTNIYTISAINSLNCLTSWSNWGNPPVDFAEPGNTILSLKMGGGTTTMSGTSMAAPHAAGLLLLGTIRSVSTACSDPDGKPDPIGIH